MRCVLVGNYGVGNMGDEALKEYFLRTFPDIEWFVLSAYPQAGNEYSRLPGGIRSFLSFKWISTIGLIRGSDALVFGGGSLFTDVESVYACFLWALHAFVARLCGRPVLLAFQGMGPYKTKVGEWLARRVAVRSTFISVRDEASAKRMETWRLNQKIVQTYDPVFCFMKSQKIEYKTKNVFTIIPRHNSGKTLVDEALLLVSTNKNIQSVHILLMQPDHDGEKGIADKLVATLPLRAQIIPIHTVSDIMQELGVSAHVLSQRFHGALAALAADVPVTILPQGEGDKLWELQRRVEHDAFYAKKCEEETRVGEESLRQTLKQI